MLTTTLRTATPSFIVPTIIEPTSELFSATAEHKFDAVRSHDNCGKHGAYLTASNTGKNPHGATDNGKLQTQPQNIWQN